MKRSTTSAAAAAAAAALVRPLNHHLVSHHPR
jgi:hypothetical protein